MSGSGGGRGDSFGGGPIATSTDVCGKTRRGPINSPKAAVLATLTVGSVLALVVRMIGSTPILVVQYGGADAGSLTFVGYLEIIECIQKQDYAYDAKITNISGGVFEVEVAPK